MTITDQLLANSRFLELMRLNEEVDEAHDLSHFKRVTKYALEIGQEEGADLEILEAAGMLHDIARGLETSGKVTDHLVAGAELTTEILSELEFPPEKITSVAYAVSIHQRRVGTEAKTLEAKIIQDADLLDTFGLIYATRSLVWGVQSKKYRRPVFVDEHLENWDDRYKNLSTIHYLLYRLNDPLYDPKTLHTSKAQSLATEKKKLLHEFVSNFIKEARGQI